MFISLTKIINLLLAYKYMLLFPIAVIEGPIITVIAGFLSSKGLFMLWIAYAIVVFADFAGDTLYYSIGKFGGRPFIRRFGHYLKIDENKLASAENYFKNHGGKTLLFGKIQAWGALILIAAGIGKMHYWRFILFCMLGTIPKSLLFILIGYYFGHAYDLINRYLGIAGAISFAVLFAGMFAFIMLKISKRKP